MRQTREVRDHRLPGDFLTERERQGRRTFRKGFAGDEFFQLHRKALLLVVGDFKPHVGRTGNCGNDAHGVNRERAR